MLEDEKKIVFQILEVIKGGQNEKIISYHL